MMTSDILWWVTVVLAAGWVASVVNVDAPGILTHLLLVGAVGVAVARKVALTRRSHSE